MLDDRRSCFSTGINYSFTYLVGGSTCAGAGSGGSLRSTDTPDDLSSSGGCPTPSSSSGDPADPAEITFTVGVTENTPYGCQFCDKAFPRLTYLKRHEQVRNCLYFNCSVSLTAGGIPKSIMVRGGGRLFMMRVEVLSKLFYECQYPSKTCPSSGCHLLVH